MPGCALVIGGAACVYDDVAAALDLGSFDGFLACNTVGIDWPVPLDAWLSLHADQLGLWAARRAAMGLAPHRRVLAPASAERSLARLPDGVTGYTAHRFPGQQFSGSSSLFAVKVALTDLGFDRVVLCGCPMDDAASHIRDTSRPWGGAGAHRRGWIETLPLIKDRVRSMSGWTKNIFGAPTGA